MHFGSGIILICCTDAVVPVTLPKNLQILPASPSKPSRRSIQSPYRLLSPLPTLPVRKGVRGRRPKSETLALLKAVAEAAAAHNGTVPSNTHLVPRVHKKRGPKPGSKVTHSQSNCSLHYPNLFDYHGRIFTVFSFPRETLKFCKALHSCQASRFHRKAPPATA